MTHTATVRYTGGLHNELTHLQSGSTIATDAPVDNHGRGEAFSPTDLLAASLAACAQTVMGIKAESLGIDLSGHYAEVVKEMAAAPRRVARITVDFYLAAALDETQRRQLEAAARACPVAHSLSAELVQDLRFHYTL